MKKILLPLSLSLLIVLALVFVAAPKKPAELPTVDPVSTGNSQTENKDLDQLADEAVSDSGASAQSAGTGNAAWSGLPDSTGSGVSSESGSGTEKSTEDSLCTDEYAPVCGSDKNTYPNACAAKRMNVESTPGACPKGDAEEGGSEPGNAGASEASPSPVQSETASSSGASAMPTVTVNGLAYDNSGLGYGFVLPKNSYFSGFGSRDGATHSVGVGRNASPESFELSEVKVRFYKGKILSQLQNVENGFYEDAENGVTYLSINGSTIAIEADRTVSGGIVDSIVKSAYVR